MNEQAIWWVQIFWNLAHFVIISICLTSLNFGALGEVPSELENFW